MPRFPSPPSDVTGPLGSYLREVCDFINSQPQISIQSFSATATPNSLVSGFPGDLCVNIGSASTASRLWLLGGAARSSITNKGWQIVRVVAP